MIVVSGISKRFKLYSKPSDRLKEIILRRPFHTSYQALDNVSFSVADGEAIGIIGPNGAGKSTLLKILTGVLLPDSGSISVTGKVTGLLELGTGFNPEMTGRQNIYMNGLLLGMSREEIQRKEEMIVDFAELGEFIDEPIKTYSSGMVMRLAFAVAYNAEPACFVVDEALSVGDAYFSQKCMRAIRTFQEKGGSIVFVSHDITAVCSLCTQALLLNKGNVIRYGAPKDVSNHYEDICLARAHSGMAALELEINSRNNENGRSKATTGEVTVEDIVLINSNGEKVNTVKTGEVIAFSFIVKSKRKIEDPHYGLRISNRLGIVVYGTNTYCSNIKTFTLDKGFAAKIIYKIKIDIAMGEYTLTIGVANGGYNKGSFEEYLYMGNNIISFSVIDNDKPYYDGVIRLYPDIIVTVEKSGNNER